MRIFEPFCRGLFWSDMGPVECRVGWPHEAEFPPGAILISEACYAPWMDVPFEMLLEQTEFLDGLPLRLPKRGFRRSV